MHADDMALVREFAERNSEEAFATLVRRHVNLVYSVALRRLGNAHEAEEVTQAVFVILARKAGDLRPGTVLSGWLYQTAQLTSANFQRAAIRRQRREQEAFMQSVQESEPDHSWRRLGPLLEEAMARLGQKERDAVVLRFFENRSVREVADALGVQEAAAQKRVSRATDKLRDFFVKRGIQVSTAALLASIGTHAVQAAPAELASTVAATAALKGAAASGSTLTLIKTTLKLMAWAKAKTAILTGTAVLLAAGTTTVAVNKIQAGEAANGELWRTPNITVQLLEQAPPQVRILPTKFPDGKSRMLRLRGSGTNRRVAGIAVPVSDLVSAAYYGGGSPVTPGAPSRTIFATSAPSDRYDFICTVPSNPGQALQQELKKQLGLAGRRETRETEVLLLKIKYPNARGLKPNPNTAASRGSSGGGRVTFVAAPLSTIADSMENILGVPVLDRTGTTATFDITLTVDEKSEDREALKQAVLDQLGLELVPGREQIEMLVVKKEK